MCKYFNWCCCACGWIPCLIFVRGSTHCRIMLPIIPLHFYHHHHPSVILISFVIMIVIVITIVIATKNHIDHKRTELRNKISSSLSAVSLFSYLVKKTCIKWVLFISPFIQLSIQFLVQQYYS